MNDYSGESKKDEEQSFPAIMLTDRQRICECMGGIVGCSCMHILSRWIETSMHFWQRTKRSIPCLGGARLHSQLVSPTSFTNCIVPSAFSRISHSTLKNPKLYSWMQARKFETQILLTPLFSLQLPREYCTCVEFTGC
jgi:hypothetical protein